MRRLLAVAALALALPGTLTAGTPLTVFAASSLTEVFPRVDHSPRYSFAGSDQLALQIRQGAPVDVYASASPKYAELLYRDGFVRRPVVFATNTLVVLLPRSNAAGIHTVYDLRRPGLKVVVGDPTVPVGSYTRQILDALGISTEVLKNVVSEETDVKSIVAKVALGEADAGFVYRTDAKPVATRTRTVAVPGWAQPPIRYELAVVRASSHQKAARAFVQKVLSKRGRLTLARAGFGLPNRR